MKIDSRFLPRPEAELRITMTLDGEPITTQVGDTVAAAVLAHSGDAFRSAGQDTPRAAYCMMGVCFECLLEIDGRANMQGCMTHARDGMVIRRQNGLRKLNGDTDD
ncbi:(2Fe-2S)-binding protein [Sulfitobacter mediterraneus]|uniref:(2Fe-2S)-binding protein n=1 Tax=Sulfitobacter mediterraneus TaxID=83219 RepID=UPI002490EC86|nr:(2Fe-2S)-binding protein [Sulfitobacter mediterraneus]